MTDRIDSAITEALDDCARRLHVAAVVRQMLDDAQLARQKEAN